ncbi:MAG TPA: phage tail tube protein [Burkholderiales bacterium]
MTVQSNILTTLAYQPEVSFGVAPGAGAAKYLRRVSSSLNLQKDGYVSREMRADQQVSDFRHGGRRGGGTIEGELSLLTWDDFILAALRASAWAAGASKSQAEFTSVAADNPTSKFTVAASTWAAQGFRVGDVIRFSGLSDADNNSKNFRITSLSGVDAFVTPAPDTMGADNTFTVAVAGFKATNGTTKTSFTIEQNYPDLDISEQFLGARVGALSFRLPPNNMAGIAAEIMAQDVAILSGASAPYFSSPTAETTTSVFSGVKGNLSIAGAVSALVTGAEVNLNLGLSTTPVIGSQIAPDIFYGRSVVTGNVSAYLDGVSLINAFLNETDIDLALMMELPGSNPLDFITLVMNKINFTGVSKTISAEGGVIASFPFQAILNSGTGYDTGTLSIQKSS